MTVTHFHWQPGPLGRFYHGVTHLTDAGSTHANLRGLAHFTTQPDQTPEAGSVVDLGYHYPPVTANGLPLDTDTDGIPDYLDADADADNLPDAWEFLHFGHLAQGPDDDYDGDNVSNLGEFLAESNPNDLKLAAQFPSLFVNQTNLGGICVVQQGVPFELAVLVNDTNLANAHWQPFASNFTATLGPADGNYTVRVAWRGRDLEFPPVWDDTEITLDRGAPVLVITNPIGPNATVTKPYLQLLGFANEPLAALSGDLTNAAGTRSNLLVTVIGQDFDPEVFDFTTNYFQAFDVPLVTNANHLTLRAADRAGNLTVTNLTVFLDYSGATNPPMVQVTWPPANALVSGESFTVRGQLDDETAELVAEIVDAEGETNTVAGLVERNGTFWLEGLPLKPGTNTVWLTATSAAGQTTQSTLSVVQSDLALTVTSTPEGENLWDGTGWAGGTVGDASCSVSVNGVTATVDANGNWSAEAVPLYGEGTVRFAVVATRPGDPAVHRLVEKEKPAVIRVTKHFLKQVLTAPTYTDTWLKEFRQWPEDAGGVRRFRHVGKASRIVTSIYPDDDYNYITEYQWSDTNVAGTFVTTYASGGSVTGIISSPLVRSVPDRQVDHLESGPTWTHEYHVEHYFAKGVRHEWPGLLGSTIQTLVAKTEETMVTGGQADADSLYRLRSSGYGYGKPGIASWTYTPNWEWPKVGASMGNRLLDWAGRVWCDVADNSKTIITTQVAGERHYTATPLKDGGYKLAILRDGIPQKHSTAMVGERVAFDAVLTDRQGQTHPITNIQWIVSGYAISNFFVDSSSRTGRVDAVFETRSNTVSFCWVTPGDRDGLNKVTAAVQTPVSRRTDTVEVLVSRPDVQHDVCAILNPVQVADGRLGLGADPEVAVGFQWKVSNLTPGRYGWLQVINNSVRRAQKDGQWVRYVVPGTNLVHGLDGIFPKEVWLTSWTDSPGTRGGNVDTQDDEPLTAGYSHAQASDSISTYLMYRPDVTTGDSWVPLFRCDWGWSGSAATNGGSWSLSAATTNISPPTATATFPEWQNNVVVGQTNLVRWIYE